jgi:hypothetical protein
MGEGYAAIQRGGGLVRVAGLPYIKIDLFKIPISLNVKCL